MKYRITDDIPHTRAEEKRREEKQNGSLELNSSFRR